MSGVKRNLRWFDPVLMELVLLTLLRIQFNGKTWPNVMNSVLICFIVTLVTVFLTVARKLRYVSMIDYLSPIFAVLSVLVQFS